MRRIILFLSVFLIPLTARANDSAVEMLRTQGLAATEAELASASDPADQFLLAGVRFLRALEKTFQMRWKMGLQHMGPIPVLRIPVAENPNPAPFDPAIAAEIFEVVVADMQAARAALDAIGEADFTLELPLENLWFDINMNGQQDRGEALLVSAGRLAGMRRLSTDEAQSIIVDFDRSDADWLRAYTHLLSGIGTLVLAFDPTEPVRKIHAAEQTIRTMRQQAYDKVQAGEMDATDIRTGPLHMMDKEITLAAMYLATIEQQPDANRTRVAKDHFIAMVDANTAFWTRVSAETDAGREWIPNAAQTSAFGIPLPDDAGEVWQGVLADAKKVLKGELLIPFWRFAGLNGINIAKLMDDPPSINFIGILHGVDLLPYMETGEVMTTQSWRQFSRMVQGDTVLFALWFN